MDLRRLALLVGVIALLILVGVEMRAVLGLDLSPDSIRERVIALGWLAPLVYVLLLAFRQFLALPSAVILPAGGALFGVVGGTALGGCGVLASGALCFALGRGLARSRKQRTSFPEGTGATRTEARRGWLAGSDLVRTAAPTLLAVITAHPTGPLTAAHSAAGMSSLPWMTFLLATGAGALVRAFVLSFFGAALLELGSLRFWGATLLVLALAFLPFLYPPFRNAVFRRSAES